MDNVKVILINSKDEILLLHRDNIPTIPSPNKWSFVGGGLEDETPEEGIRRETKEEIDYDIKDIKLFKVYEDDIKRHIFVANIDKEISELTLTEGDDFGFFTIKEALELDLSDNTRRYIQDYFDIS